ncbi:MAG: DUF6930 domain-containing protein [Ignavibacteriales bacterium]
MTKPVEPVIDATPQEWKSLYSACEEFRRLAPWDWMDDTQVVGVEDPDSGRIGWCVVMGNARETFGLWVYRGAHGYGTYCLLAAGIEPDFEDIAKMDYLSLSFEDRGEIDRHDLELIRKSGLRPRGRQSWPQVLSKTPWRVPWRLNAREVRYMTLVLHQISRKAIDLKENPGTPLVKGSRLLVRRYGQVGQDWGWSDVWLEPGEPEHERVMVTLDSAEIRDIKLAAQVTSETWEVDVFPLLRAVGGEGIPYYPMTLLVVNRGVPPVIHSLIVKPEPGGWQLLAESFVSALKQTGRIPRRIRVKRPEVAAMLGAICSALGVKLKEVERLTVLDEVRTSLEDSLGQ